MAQCGPLMTLGKKPFENIVEKGENACESMFRFSHNILYCIKLHHLSLFSNCHLQMLSLLRRLNFCCLINGKQNASLRFTDGKLLVKLACLDISPEGRLWLGNTVINKTIWFQLLHRTVPIIHCKVIIPRVC